MHSKTQASRGKLQRRLFLSALALGTTVPFATYVSRLAVAGPAERTPRLFIYYVPHGLPIEHTEVGEDFDLTAPGVGVFGGLTPFKKHLTILRGVGNVTQSNHVAIRSTLSGQDGSPSIDRLIGQQLGIDSHVLGVLSNRKEAGSDAHLFYHDDWVEPIANPYDAIGLGAGETHPATQEAEFRRAALSLSEKQLERLQQEAKELSADESKLTQHLAALSELKARGDHSACGSEAEFPAAAAMKDEDPLAPGLFATILDGHLEVAAQDSSRSAQRRRRERYRRQARLRGLSEVVRRQVGE